MLNPAPCPIQFLYKGIGRSEHQWLNQVLALQTTSVPPYQPVTLHTAIPAVQEQLEEVSQWFPGTEPAINAFKAQALCCASRKKAARQEVPSVPFNGEVNKRTNGLRNQRIHFKRMLMKRSSSNQQNSSAEKDCPR